MKNEQKKNKLNKTQKIEAAIAAFLTIVALATAGVLAWFSISSSMETMTKVKEPDNLDIRAGNFNQILNFELSGINIEEMDEENRAEYRVFSVNAGDYKIAYKIQLAHTTNIPFKYSLYHATRRDDVTEQDSENSYVEYHPIADPEDITYYEIGDLIELEKLNPDEGNVDNYGRVLGKSSGTIYSKTYDDPIDDPEIYAIPIYKQTKYPIDPTSKESEDKHDYFILKIEWDKEAANKGLVKWNKAENNKETDVIYITASRSTT